MPTALLAGAFGQHNPGDEALLDAFLAALPDWRLVATSREPDWTATTQGCDAVQSQDRFAVGRALLAADAVVVAGGTVFNTLHPSTGRSANDLLRGALLLAEGARICGKPLAMLGTGVGALPNRRARWLARAVVRRANLLVLRDEESAHALARAGAPIPFRVGADPAWTIVHEPPSEVTDGDTVIVALSHLAGDDRLPEWLGAALEAVVASGLSVHLQPWQSGQGSHDIDLARAVARRLPGAEVVDPPADLLEARAAFTYARLAVCMRFHAMVAAAAAGTPLVAIAFEAKQAGLARRLRQPVVAATRSPSEVADTISVGLDGPAASPAAVRAEIARAGEGFRLLRLLLTRGAASEFESFDGLSLEPVPWTTM